MRKFYPWIPIIGIFLVAGLSCKEDSSKFYETRLNEPMVFCLSAIVQAVVVVGLGILITFS